MSPPSPASATMWLFLTGLLLAAPARGMRAATDSMRARIVLERVEDLVRIRATFTGRGGLPDTLAYRLVVRRVGAGGTSVTRQSGTFEPEAGAMVTLSTTRVNVTPGSRLGIHLAILRDDHVIARDEIDKTF